MGDEREASKRSRRRLIEAVKYSREAPLKQNFEHCTQFKRYGVEVIEARHCRADLALDFRSPVYVSVDMDGLDPAFAPGVSHREPGGLSTRQVIDLIHSVNQPIVAADIVEYNPRCDISNITAPTANPDQSPFDADKATTATPSQNHPA